MKLSRFAKFAWGALVYTIAVILWGAYVRISFSGDGCGDHWPLCQGAVIPASPSVKTLIELSHRSSSGLLGLIVLAMTVWAFRAYPKGSLVRAGAAVSLLFIIVESLLGAGLVKFGLVNKDDSINRAVVMSLHLVNTLVLVAATALTAWWASGGKPLRWRHQKGMALALGAGVAATIFLAISGAITALGDTLFPPGSHAEAIEQHFSPTAHVLMRLRIFHPVIALVVAAYVIFIAVFAGLSQADKTTARLSRLLIAAFITQISLGFLNLYLLAPTWMQLVHLLMADTVWITLVLFTASALSSEATATDYHAATEAPALN
jgi:heme A synthase